MIISNDVRLHLTVEASANMYLVHNNVEIPMRDYDYCGNMLRLLVDNGAYPHNISTTNDGCVRVRFSSHELESEDIAGSGFKVHFIDEKYGNLEYRIVQNVDWMASIPTRMIDNMMEGDSRTFVYVIDDAYNAHRYKYAPHVDITLYLNVTACQLDFSDRRFEEELASLKRLLPV